VRPLGFAEVDPLPSRRDVKLRGLSNRDVLRHAGGVIPVGERHRPDCIHEAERIAGDLRGLRTRKEYASETSRPWRDHVRGPHTVTLVSEGG
jgi:hypothetical protein